VSVKEDDDNKTSLNGTTSLSGTTRGGAVKTSCHQSILVSGESGAGKTVTTKFVMKYLAALSQRSVARQTESATRAYVKVQQQQREQQQQQLQQRQQLQLHSSPVRGGRLSSSASSHQKFQQPAWGVARKDKLTSISSINNNSGGNSVSSRGGAGSNNSDLASLTTMLSSSTTTGSAGSSIESQVLQSNPILESFGNARTVRNDNSSRFGKFIEIQFTGRGQLVGANIETYLLEKVRLVHQSNGERNYHVFYELLSGGMDSRELSQYFIAKTAAPEDFKLTASGTYDRRDGVTDRETYRALRTACSAMKFGIAEIHQIFSVTAALLHASNLNICDEGRHSSSSCEKSYVDTTNVHLTPVCHLLGITQEDLDRAVCQHLIQAGRESVVSQCLSRERAEKGLEALLKATYGALFSYLVRRINDSIAYKDASSSYSASDSVDLQDQDVMAAHPGGAHSQRLKPVASIGVLDIFGFESFAKNSFEQLCINYCNEALQQQFNAFVLKNEQAEYEREGIEWSFIEFPENQDVLDLIDKRGGGILSVLDDQCRAPGSSDKAFCLDVYKICTGNARFSVDSRQHASLQFSVQHYAGPVEYTTDGFTEKNRDELSKEATDLLKNSRIEFVQELAWIIECSHEMPAEAPGSSSMNNSVAATPSKQFHRADSSVGRATVGGQFRRQLRNLRTKVDQTTPHYIRCLKPNDHLIPDVFDTAVVAEQLRCGGILEAVRVARAGFTQHYPHDDFCRRYRTLAWRELAKKDFGSPGIFASSSSGNLNKSSRSSGFHRNGSFLPSPLPPLGSSGGSVARGKSFRGGSSNKVKATKPEVALSPAEAKAQCKDLVKILYRKIQQQEMDDEHYNDSLRGSSSMHVESPPPIARSFSFQSTPPPTSSRPASSWSTKSRQPVHSYLPPMPSSSSSVGGGTNASVKSRYTAWEKKADPPKQEVAPPNPLWKRGGLSQSDYAKIGIQLGKTKVFLRHKAFETLERMRSREQIKAATMLNAIFRMYLAKSAYLPYRDAFRMEMYDCRQRSGERDDFKESKDQEGDFDDCGSTYRFRQALRLHRTGSFYCQSLVDKWMESKIRNAIHNPVPRHEWGKSAPTSGSFKWVLSEGIWIRNYNI
jgi:myosin heavy subunit